MFIEWMDHGWAIRPVMDTGLFPPLAAVNTAAGNVGVCVMVGDPAFRVVSTQGGIARSHSNSVRRGNPHLFPTAYASFHFPTGRAQGAQYFHLLTRS